MGFGVVAVDGDGVWGAVGEDVEGVGALVVLGALDEDLVAGGVEVD